MKKKISIILLIISNLSIAENLEKTKDGPTIWENEKPNITSPVTVPNAAWVLGVGSVLTYIVFKAKDDNGDIGYIEDHKEKTEGDWRYWGDILGWGAFQAGYTLTQLPGIKRGEKRALENTEMMWKSTIYTSLTTLGLKLSVKEQRRNGEIKYESFPSGHASAAFAFATNVAIRHEWYWNFVSIPLATWASLARIEDDSHYVHDSIFGAALGISFAVGMNYMSKDTPYLLGFAPKEDGGGVVFKYKF